jgi:hypothetical protein
MAQNQSWWEQRRARACVSHIQWATGCIGQTYSVWGEQAGVSMQRNGIQAIKAPSS